MALLAPFEKSLRKTHISKGASWHPLAPFGCALLANTFHVESQRTFEHRVANSASAQHSERIGAPSHRRPGRPVASRSSVRSGKPKR